MTKTIDIKGMELSYYHRYEFLANEIKDIVDFFDMQVSHIDNENILLSTIDNMEKININHYNNKIAKYDFYIDNTLQKQD